MIRYRDALGIPFKQFVMHVKLIPDEVKRRLTEAVEPFSFFRNPFTLNVEAYEGQWLTADRFELYRTVGKNAWYVYGEISPYPQETTLIKVTLKTSLLGPLLLVYFLLNPIMLGILTSPIPSGRAMNLIDMLAFIPITLIFCGLPVSFLIIVGVVTYGFTLTRESDKARAFLERVFATI
jgi:hypothetical protein